MDRAKSSSLHIVPLALWLAVQLGGLLLAVARVPLSDQFVRPAERVALEEMLVVQIAATAMLFPVLLRTASDTIVMAAASWPFTQLAGVLSGAPGGRVFLASLYVTMWIVALGIWRRSLPAGRWEKVGGGVATLLAVGGPILWYIGAEFGGLEGSWGAVNTWGPIMGALAVVHQDSLPAKLWLALGGAVVLGVIMRALQWQIQRRTPGKSG